MERIGTLYLELNYENKYAMLYYPVFLVRRLVYIYLIFQMTDKKGIAVMINIQLSILFTSYLILIKPFKSLLVNCIQMFNEACLMAVNYHMLLFTDYIPDNELKVMICWSVLMVTFTMMAGNLIPMLVH